MKEKQGPDRITIQLIEDSGLDLEKLFKEYHSDQKGKSKNEVGRRHRENSERTSEDKTN